MHSSLLSLEAIERTCSQERSKKFNASHNEKALHSKKKGTKRPGTGVTARVRRKLVPRNTATSTYKKHGGAYTTHNTRDCHRFEKDGTEKSNFRTAKKGRKKPNPTKQSFAQLSKK